MSHKRNIVSIELLALLPFGPCFYLFILFTCTVYPSKVLDLLADVMSVVLYTVACSVFGSCE